MDCVSIEDRVLRGEPIDAAEAGVRDHLADCASCRFILEEGRDVARALAAGSPRPEALELASLERQLHLRVEAERGVLAWARALPRTLRLAMVAALIALEVIFVLELLRRSDLDVYPRARMGMILAAYAVLALVTGWHALRPLYLPPTPAWKKRLVLGVGLLLPLGIAVLPEVPTTVGTAGFHHAKDAFYCVADGGLIALAVLLLVRALDRGGHAGFAHAAAAAITAGAAGLLALQLQCPFNQPAHLVLGHATLPVLIVAVTLAFRRVTS
jgi:hypothetical protein